MRLLGKRSLEQLFLKYDGLFHTEYINEKVRYGSGWCEVENELFEGIMKALPDLPKDSQNEMAAKILQIEGEFMPADLAAERMMSLKTFCRQDVFENSVARLYRNCLYTNALRIANPSVVDGLKIIRGVFEKYSGSISSIRDEKPTDFLDIAIAIYDMLSPQKA